MKRIFLLIIALILSFSMYSCELNTENISSTEDSDVDISNPSDIVTIHNAEIYADYAVLPLCDAITALGFQLTWNNDDLATFVCNDISYEISISNKTLTEAGDDENYLICAPGNAHFVCEVRNGTLMVDDNTVQCLFQTFLDYPVRISIDYDENVIIIEE
jgi:hypothetical protein